MAQRGGGPLSPFDIVQRDAKARTAFLKLIAAGCVPDALEKRINSACRIQKYNSKWYELKGFPIDKLQRYPRRLRTLARQIEQLNSALAKDSVYLKAIAALSEYASLNLGRTWFQRNFKDLPDNLRIYASAIAMIETFVRVHAPIAGKMGAEMIGAEGFVDYVRVATGKPHYEDCADILAVACPERFRDVDATALRKRFTRSRYVQEVEKLRAARFRDITTPPAST